MTAPPLLLEQLANSWLDAIVRASWQGGLALMVAWGICVALARMPARIKCWVWRAGYAKLLVAGLWASPLLLPVLPPEPVPDRPASRAGLPVVISNELLPVHPLVPAARPFPWRTMLFSLWFVGTAAFSVQLTFEWRAALRLRRTAYPASDARPMAMIGSLASSLRLGKVPALLVCDRVSGPLLLGIGQPAIVVPPWLLTAAKPQDVRLMLAHELAHLKRHDLLWGLLPRVARVLFFFHPVVWLAERQWKLAKEMACDAAAIQLTQTGAGEYGRALLNVALRQTRPAPPLLAVGVVGSRQTLRRRLLAMQTLNHWSRRRVLAAGVIVSCLGAVVLVPWRVVAQEPRVEQQSRRGRPATGPATRGASSTQPAGTAHSFSGRMVSRTVELRSRITGVVDVVGCKEGQHINKGQTIIQLNETKARAAYLEAQTMYRKAATELNRKKKLREQGAISQDEFEEVAAARDAAAAQLEIKNEESAETRIAAPIAGVVTSCDLIEGQTVTPDRVLAKIVETDALRVELELPFGEAMHVRVGSPLAVRTEAYGGKFDGQVTFISPTVDGPTQTVTIKGTINSEGGKLRPGMVVEGTLFLEE